MQKLKEGDLEKSLEDIGITNGDHLIIHSAAMAFGYLPNGINSILDPLLKIVGENGTIAAPTFTFGFIQSGSYHWQDTPSQKMGALNEAIRKHSDSRRTWHPIQSISILGKYAERIAIRNEFSAYEDEGSFDQLTKLGFKILTLGVDANFISLSHLSEERFNVPYRFMKHVKGKACFKDNDHTQGDWGFYARKQDLPARPAKEDIIVTDLKRDGKWSETQLNGATIACGYAKDFCDRLDFELEKDPYWMLTNADEVKALCEKAS